MAEASLKRQQLWIHLGALVLGLLLGRVGGFGELATALLWPVLAALLLVTFAQIPLAHLREGLADRRFLAAMLGGQFLVIPLVVALLVGALPADPGLRLGVALVLLAPCTDWFVSFTWLGGGDAARALAVTPLTLLLQLALVPAWLGLILPGSLGSVGPAAWLPGWLALALPLSLALLLDAMPMASGRRARLRKGVGRLGVPLLALVVLLVAAAQSPPADRALALLGTLLPVFAGYLLAALLLALALARGLGLEGRLGRTLAFGFGTRNSFVVLPVALGLDAGHGLAAAAIVLQALVELAGMLVFLRLLPRLFP